MRARWIRVVAVVGLSGLALVAAVNLSISDALAREQVNTGAPAGTQIKPSYTDVSTLTIAGYESPETSTVVGEPGSAP